MVKILNNYFVGFMYNINKIDTINAIITLVNLTSSVTYHKFHIK